MPNTEPLLTAAQVAIRWQVHAETVRRWTRDGLITVVMLPGGRKRYRPEDVDRVVVADIEAAS